MQLKRRIVAAGVMLATFCFVLSGCTSSTNTSTDPNTNVSSVAPPNATFKILAASENKDVVDVIKQLAPKGYELQFDLKGSVDIMRTLKAGKDCGYDAVWPADGMWILLGDDKHVVSKTESVFKSPVIFELRRSIARRLGWDRKEVSLSDIFNAAKNREFKFAMTSATQSNSGSQAYFAFLSGFANKTSALTIEDLGNKSVLAKTKDLLRSADRSSGSSGALTDLFVQKGGAGLDGMFNYESQLVTVNSQPNATDPLYAIYPSGGLAVADYPLGFIDQGDSGKRKFFEQLQDTLSTPAAQTQFAHAGRRTSKVGIRMDNADPKVFRADWGIDTRRKINILPTPGKATIDRALTLYQEVLRKPSETVFVLDYSGSMGGDRIAQLKQAMTMLLEPTQAKAYYLQPSVSDKIILVLFSSGEPEVYSGSGSPEDLKKLLGNVIDKDVDGGTELYAAAGTALKQLEQESERGKYHKAVVLLTDGEADDSLDSLERVLGHKLSADLPIYAIRFGDASADQLDALTGPTNGKTFDANKEGVEGAFRKARGYN